MSALVAVLITGFYVKDGGGAWLFGAIVLAAATIGLLDGRRLAWLFLTIIASADILAVLIARSPFMWSAVAANALMLALLLAPSTRHWAQRPLLGRNRH